MVFTFLLIVVVILVIIGIGWNTFFTGIINGFERVIDVGTPIVKDLTQDISLMIALRTLLLSD